MRKIRCDGQDRLTWSTEQEVLDYMTEKNYGPKHWQPRQCPNPEHGFHLRSKTNPPAKRGYSGSEEPRKVLNARFEASKTQS